MAEHARRRVIDQALCDRARRLAGYHELQDVAAILRLHPAQVSRIKKRGWRAATHDALRRPMPADLAAMQHAMTVEDLARHYRCCVKTVLKWLAELPERRPSWRGRSLRRSAS